MTENFPEFNISSLDEPLVYDDINDTEEVSSLALATPSRKKVLLSVLGLSISQAASRAYSAVTGVLLTLLVATFSKDALLITLALLSGRFVSWLILPVAGRLSDQHATSLGRRTPLIAGSLVSMAICLYLLPSSPNYIDLVLILIFMRIASSIYSLSSASITPEVVGKSKWISGLVLIGILGTFLSFLVKGKAILSWKQGDIATYAAPFHMSAFILLICAALVLVLVRESDAFRLLATKDRRANRNTSLIKRFVKIFEDKNNAIFLLGILAFWLGTGAISTLGALFLSKDLHVGGSTQVIFGILTGIPAIIFGTVAGYMLSRILSRKQIFFISPIIGSMFYFGMLFVNNLYEIALLIFLGSPLIFAFLIVSFRFLVNLIPSEGGLGQALGLFSAPFAFASVTGSFMSAALVHIANNNYRYIWFIPAVATLMQGILLVFYKVPDNLRKITKKESNDLRKQIKEILGTQFRNSKGQFGLLRPVLDNRVDENEANGQSVILALQNYFKDSGS